MKTVVNGVMEEVVGLSCEEQRIIKADMIKEELLKDKVEIIRVNNGGKHEENSGGFRELCIFGAAR